MSTEVDGVPPDEQLMTLARTDRDGWAVLVVRGSVDIATEHRLAEAAREPLTAGRPLVLDVSGVEFLSSSGAAQLVVLADEGRRRRVPLRVVAGENRRVGQLIVTLGLNRALAVFASVELAVSS